MSTTPCVEKTHCNLRITVRLHKLLDDMRLRDETYEDQIWKLVKEAGRA